MSQSAQQSFQRPVSGPFQRPSSMDSTQSSVASSGDRILSANMSSSDDSLPTTREGQKYRFTDEISGPPKVLPSMRDDVRAVEAQTQRDAPSAEADDPQPQTPSRRSQREDDSPRTLSRDEDSIYSLSRPTMSSQLSQLVSLQLPQPSSLSSNIASLLTSTAAAKALTGAAKQIKRWLQKASEVLSGLDADDDVEGAAAGGRAGLAAVETAVRSFEEVVDVYVESVEKLQLRRDIGSVHADDLAAVVHDMDHIMAGWRGVRTSLRTVKTQVDLAMEWHELWTVVIGDIRLEIEELTRMIFEMEERRHRSATAEANGAPGGAMDIVELETIVEEAPAVMATGSASNRFSFPPTMSVATPETSNPASPRDDGSLLALFARMQPLRASLDFLPIRLSSFHLRAQQTFPTACQELQSRRKTLESEWKQLHRDAETLRREIAEDRWILVFRDAGRKAQKMCESVARGTTKVREALDSGLAHINRPSFDKRVQNYEAKKLHYGPAIQRVLAIIDKGVNDRLTVNGEILRLQEDMNATWKSLEGENRGIDAEIAELNLGKGRQLRDSVSSLVSMDRSAASTVADTAADTPGTSPPPSVVMANGAGKDSAATVHQDARPGKASRSSIPRLNTGYRASDSPPPNGRASSFGKRPCASQPTTNKAPIAEKRLSASSSTNERSSNVVKRLSGSQPAGDKASKKSPTATQTITRPRWNSSVNTRGTIIGHNFKPLTLTSPYKGDKAPMSRVPRPTASISDLRHPRPRPWSRDDPSPTSSGGFPVFARGAVLSSSPTEAGPAQALPRSRVTSQPTSQPQRSEQEQAIVEVMSKGAGKLPLRPKSSRPASAMANNLKRTSLLPQLKTGGATKPTLATKSTLATKPTLATQAASVAMRSRSSSLSTKSVMSGQSGTSGGQKPRWRC